MRSSGGPAFVSRTGSDTANSASFSRPGCGGAGYATKLARALVRWHDTHSEADLVSSLRAYVFADNQGSRKVLERTGFQLIGSDYTDERQLIYETPW